MKKQNQVKKYPSSKLFLLGVAVVGVLGLSALFLLKDFSFLLPQTPSAAGGNPAVTFRKNPQVVKARTFLTWITVEPNSNLSYSDVELSFDNKKLALIYQPMIFGGKHFNLITDDLAYTNKKGAVRIVFGAKKQDVLGISENVNIALYFRVIDTKAKTTEISCSKQVQFLSALGEQNDFTCQTLVLNNGIPQD